MSNAETPARSRRTPKDSPAWAALLLVIIAMGAVGYYAFFATPSTPRTAQPSVAIVPRSAPPTPGPEPVVEPVRAK